MSPFLDVSLYFLAGILTVVAALRLYGDPGDNWTIAFYILVWPLMMMALVFDFVWSSLTWLRKKVGR